LLLFLFKTKKSTKTKISASKKEEIPIRYNIEPKSSAENPGNSVKYKVTIVNEKLDEVSGKVTLSPPDDWKVGTLEREYGPLEKGGDVELEFEFTVPTDVETGFIYKVAGNIDYGADKVESSAMIELTEKGEELLW
jgi:uncharacterized membrane protein